MPDRFVWTFSTTLVFVYNLPRERHRKLKNSRNVEPFEELKIIRIELIEGFIVEPILAAKFSYLLFVDIVGMQKKQVVALVLATLDL